LGRGLGVLWLLMKLVKLHGLRAYIWSAVDVDSGEILAIYASSNRNMLIQFI